MCTGAASRSAAYREAGLHLTFVALILAALARREPQDKELIVIVIILGSVFVGLVELFIALLLGPPVE